MRAPYRMESQLSNSGGRVGPPPGLINALILGVFYGYFAMNFDGDSDICYANDSSDMRLKDDAKIDVDKNYTNVGQIFHFCF